MSRTLASSSRETVQGPVACVAHITTRHSMPVTKRIPRSAETGAASEDLHEADRAAAEMPKELALVLHLPGTSSVTLGKLPSPLPRQ